jgi:hypothetical protein
VMIEFDNLEFFLASATNHHAEGSLRWSFPEAGQGEARPYYPRSLYSTCINLSTFMYCGQLHLD